MRVSHIKIARLLILALAGNAALGCRKEDMSDQPKFYHPYHETGLFADGTTARPIPEFTVARGQLRLEKDVYLGMKAGPDGKFNVPIDYIPMQLNHADMERGQQKFDIFCAVCHGKLGDGAGMIVTRGMIRPPSLVRTDHPPTGAALAREINVQRAPVGHYYDVITNGYGAMYSYNDRIAPDDRWRIAAYIKALQLSQDADTKYVLFRPPPSNGAPVPVQTDSKAVIKDEPMPGNSAAPAGPAPGGATPAGTAPGGVTPNGPTPRSATPRSATPGGAAPTGAMPATAPVTR